MRAIMLNWSVLQGSAVDVLTGMASESVHAIVTSPPYFAQRDYGGSPSELGRESVPSDYVSKLVRVFDEARRVLRRDGCLWLNLGDSYAGSWGAQSREHAGKHANNRSALSANQIKAAQRKKDRTGSIPAGSGLKAKDLIGIPWLTAFALREAGWWLRIDQIWHKPNPMPGSQLDRPTSAHEYVFLLSKSRRYYFDISAIKEPPSESFLEQMDKAYTNQSRKDYDAAGVQDPSDTKRAILSRRNKQRGHSRRHEGFNGRWDAMTREEQMALGSLPRSVWTIATNGHDGKEFDHFALMPKTLARKLVVSACPPGGTVLDPFAGCATTGVVALEEGRNFIGIELSPKYAAMARKRLADVAPLLAQEASGL